MNRLSPYLEKKLEELETAFNALPFNSVIEVSLGRKTEGDFPRGQLMEFTPTYFVVEQGEGTGPMKIERTNITGITWEERLAPQLQFALQPA